jgi:diguanylate cyclase (GGDEF)-like protein
MAFQVSEMTSDTGRPNGRARILAVDEDAVDLELLCQRLRPRFDVFSAATQSDAGELLRAKQELAVILAGSEAVLDQARALQPECKRVFITGAAAAQDALLRAVNGGQANYLLRRPIPDDVAAVVGSLSEAFRRERSARQSVLELRKINEELWAKESFLARSLDDQGRELLSANAEIERLSRDLEILSYRDALTGLYNHRSCQERLREEMARARRYGKPLSLLYCDIDDFARINTELGYQMGDAILRRLAEVLSSVDSSGRLRESDVAARFGGEELVILLPETSKEGAGIKAERLRSAVERASFPGERSIRVSIGLAGFPDDADTPSDLIRCAEAALKTAKEAGRNCVRVTPIEAGEGGTRGKRPSGGEPVPLRPERFTSYHVRLFDIVSSLRHDRSLSCLYIDLSQLRDIERELGPMVHAELFARAGDLLDRLRGDRLRRDDLICRTEDADGYLCFLASPRGADSPIDLEAIASRVEATLDRELRQVVITLTREHPRVVVGFSRVLENPLTRPERLVVKLVAEARRSAVLHRERAIQRHKNLLQEIILRGMLQAAYQPIVDLAAGQTFGFEALARGPRDSTLETPTALFSVADAVDLTFELDRACFRSALAGAVGLEPVHRLFVNLLPTSFYDSSFIESEVGSLLDAANLTPANVVFEITEKLAIENFASFRQALAGYTRIGFGVAIDDVGTRHSNLETVMALRPHFVKLSDVLTRGVSKSTVKREMVRSLQRIADAIDAVIVAEGIETLDDLSVLCELGVRYGQGYYLARPGEPFPEITPEAKAAMRSAPPEPGSRPRSRTATGMIDEEDGELREESGERRFDQLGHDGGQEGAEHSGSDFAERTEPRLRPVRPPVSSLPPPVTQELDPLPPLPEAPDGGLFLDELGEGGVPLIRSLRRRGGCPVDGFEEETTSGGGTVH